MISSPEIARRATTRPNPSAPATKKPKTALVMPGFFRAAGTRKTYLRPTRLGPATGLFLFGLLLLDPLLEVLLRLHHDVRPHRGVPEPAELGADDLERALLVRGDAHHVVNVGGVALGD